MKLYYDGVYAADYKWSSNGMPFRTPAEFATFNEVHEPDENGDYQLVGSDTNVTIEWEKDDTDSMAGEKILKEYPEWKQLNVIRDGSDADKAKMQTFIEAVRTWANSSNPDPWDGTLDSITP